MKFSPKLEAYRIRVGAFRSEPGEPQGAFLIRGPCGRELTVVASSGNPDLDIYWEHVSVSLTNRNPNWEEMCFIKSLFWDDEETVIQLHPPKSQWISNHPHCLHMWRPTRETIPLPPSITVGRKELGTIV